MTTEFLSMSLSDEKSLAETLSDMHIHEEWLTSNAFMKLRLGQYQENPDYRPCGPRAMVMGDTDQMIGHIGFHTARGPEYLKEFTTSGIEFGYSVYEEFRGQGFATEAIRGVMHWASIEKDIEDFVLSIAPDNAPSQALAKKFGFHKVGEHMDAEDGLEDIFILRITD